MAIRVKILRFIPVNRWGFLDVDPEIMGAKRSCENFENPTIIVVSRPICQGSPPALISIDGMTVSTSMKFFAMAKNEACQIKALKLFLEIFVVRFWLCNRFIMVCVTVLYPFCFFDIFFYTLIRSNVQEIQVLSQQMLQ